MWKSARSVSETDNLNSLPVILRPVDDAVRPAADLPKIWLPKLRHRASKFRMICQVFRPERSIQNRALRRHRDCAWQCSGRCPPNHFALMGQWLLASPLDDFGFDLLYRDTFASIQFIESLLDALTKFQLIGGVAQRRIGRACSCKLDPVCLSAHNRKHAGPCVFCCRERCRCLSH